LISQPALWPVSAVEAGTGPGGEEGGGSGGAVRGFRGG
jgi:hypothetical protein